MEKMTANQIEAKYQFLVGKKYTLRNLLNHKRTSFKITRVWYNPKLEIVGLDGDSMLQGASLTINQLDELIAKREVRKYFEDEPHAGELWTVTSLK